jgi:hypothetical protein
MVFGKGPPNLLTLTPQSNQPPIQTFESPKLKKNASPSFSLSSLLDRILIKSLFSVKFQNSPNGLRTSHLHFGSRSFLNLTDRYNAERYWLSEGGPLAKGGVDVAFIDDPQSG